MSTFETSHDADQDTSKAADKQVEVTSENVKPVLPEIATQEASTIGDENLPAREPDVVVHTDSVPAQVTGGPAAVVTEVPVHEVSVVTDEVITDTSSPLAVQIPDAGRGDASLPIHQLANGTVEQFFADHAAKSDED